MDNLTIDMDLLIKSIHKPKVFHEGKSQEAFWDDEHISKKMLESHLNPNLDAASRKTETIESSCSWIISVLNLNKNDKVIDLGCGPGLYCSKLSEYGLQVTGIDYSKRSIKYAKEEARRRKLVIDYRYMNYLDMNYNDEFDIAMMIYCDFGVLSAENSRLVLKNIHKALKGNGCFIFDVWTTSNKELTSSFRNWSVNLDGGFWRPNSYIELVDKSYYDNHSASLKQHVIIEDNRNINVYNLWERCYTVNAVTELLNENGFEVIDIFGDITGAKYVDGSNSLAVLARKKKI